MSKEDNRFEIEKYAFNRNWAALDNVLYDNNYYFYDQTTKIIYGCKPITRSWFIVKEPYMVTRLKEYNL